VPPVQSNRHGSNIFVLQFAANPFVAFFRISFKDAIDGASAATRRQFY
jgi:hypothetical protein